MAYNYMSAFRPSPYAASVQSLYRPLVPSPYSGLPGQTAPATSPYPQEQAPMFQPAALGGSGVSGAFSLAAGGSIGRKNVARSGKNTFGGSPANTAPGGGGVGNSGGGGGGGSGNPYQDQAKAQADMQSSQAYAAAIAAMKQNLIRYGDPDMVQRVLGGKIRTYGKGPMAGMDRLGQKGYKYADVQKAAANNPFSTLKELDRWNTRQGTGINEGDNNQNLYYSSTHARNLGLQGEDFLRQKTKAGNDLQDAIDAIQAQLMQSLTGIRGNYQSALSQAYG